MEVRACGIVPHTRFCFLGASPDGLVFDPSESSPNGLVEVKCLYSPFCLSLSVKEACVQLQEFCYQLSAEKSTVSLRQDHTYYYQGQGQMAACNIRRCDFVVWPKDSLHIERVAFDVKLWESEILPSLLFYVEAAVPYLVSKNLPVPPQQDRMRSLVDDCLACAERLLSSDMCQSRIGGRNGSSACAVISALLCESFLSGSFSGASDEVKTTVICEVMMEGNAVYDGQGFNGYLAADEVLDIQPSLGLEMVDESFIRPAAFVTVVDLMTTTAEADTKGLSAGVFMITPDTFCIASDGASVVVFDSHTHGNAGALLAELCKEDAVTYLKLFFANHYPGLSFSDEGGARSAI